MTEYSISHEIVEYVIINSKEIFLRVRFVVKLNLVDSINRSFIAISISRWLRHRQMEIGDYHCLPVINNCDYLLVLSACEDIAFFLKTFETSLRGESDTASRGVLSRVGTESPTSVVVVTRTGRCVVRRGDAGGVSFLSCEMTKCLQDCVCFVNDFGTLWRGERWRDLTMLKSLASLAAAKLGRTMSLFLDFDKRSSSSHLALNPLHEFVVVNAVRNLFGVTGARSRPLPEFVLVVPSLALLWKPSIAGRTISLGVLGSRSFFEDTGVMGRSSCFPIDGTWLSYFAVAFFGVAIRSLVSTFFLEFWFIMATICCTRPIRRGVLGDLLLVRPSMVFSGSVVPSNERCRRAGEALDLDLLRRVLAGATFAEASSSLSTS